MSITEITHYSSDNDSVDTTPLQHKKTAATIMKSTNAVDIFSHTMRGRQ